MTRLWYPLEADNGSLKLVSDYPEKVRQAILSAIYTEVEERVMRPDYGREVNPLDAADLPSILASLRKSVTLGLAKHPGVSFSLRGSLEDDGMVAIDVTYSSPDINPQVVSVTV